MLEGVGKVRVEELYLPQIHSTFLSSFPHLFVDPFKSDPLVDSYYLVAVKLLKVRDARESIGSFLGQCRA